MPGGGTAYARRPPEPAPVAKTLRRRRADAKPICRATVRPWSRLYHQRKPLAPIVQAGEPRSGEVGRDGRDWRRVSRSQFVGEEAGGPMAGRDLRERRRL